ncbi:MAG: zinc ABC transporter substrate-binding protein [Clostridia bacterium]|nr:zinc ABC transporter substrate-binding protein [Clostridia bacterium]
MKAKRLPLALLALLLTLLTAGYVAGFRLDKYALKEEKDDYYIYASCYPVYAISSMIMRDTPGMHLIQLTQPKEEGYTDHSLSDWESALLSNADALVLMGFGFEGFSSSLLSGKAAEITLLSMMELACLPEECAVLDLGSDEIVSLGHGSPWFYMSPRNCMQLIEVMCGNMAYLDQEYAQGYYDNLEETTKVLEPIAERSESIDCLKGCRVAVAHDALLYTASDLGAETCVYIGRKTTSELSEEDVSKCIDLLLSNDVHVLLIEEQAVISDPEAFEKAGITVIRQQLMLDRTPAFSYSGLLEGLSANLDAIEKAFS